MQASIAKLGHRITPFGAVLVTAIVSGMISCNQTLSTMLTFPLKAFGDDGRDSYMESQDTYTTPQDK